MSKQVKQLLTDELQKKFTGVNEFIVVDLTGIDGITNNRLRGQLRQKGISLTMVRNAMMRKAMAAMGKETAADLFATGSCTVASGGDSVVDLAKEIKAINIGKTPIKFRGAYVEGAVLDAAGAGQLATMKTRVEMLGEIVMLANSPGRRIAGAIAGPAGIIAGCVKAIAEKAEKAAA
ncbi:MAG: 50S ribosomal protein L10 [Sedimentisphaerales bacterium]